MKKLLMVLAICTISIAANATDCIDTANFWTNFYGFDVSTLEGLNFWQLVYTDCIIQ